MLAFVQDQVDNVHDRFLAMLPSIKQIARHAFSGHEPEAREELIQETIANSYMAFNRLFQLGKLDLAFATPLAKYAVRQIRSGRRVGTKLNINDVLSPANRHVVVRQFDPHEGGWKEAVVEDRHTGPAETACARIDLGQWFRSLGLKKRRIAQALAQGETTSDAAKKFKVTAGRVSQLRRELETAWQQFQGEPVAA
jgi:hypothetical protein